MATEIKAPQKTLAQVDRESLRGDVGAIKMKLKLIRDAAIDSLDYVEKYCK